MTNLNTQQIRNLEEKLEQQRKELINFASSRAVDVTEEIENLLNDFVFSENDLLEQELNALDINVDDSKHTDRFRDLQHQIVQDSLEAFLSSLR